MKKKLSKEISAELERRIELVQSGERVPTIRLVHWVIPLLVTLAITAYLIKVA